MIKVGDKFGEWEVVGEAVRMEKYESRPIGYPVRCACGTLDTIAKTSLVYGKSTSCGCKQWKHGLAGKHRLYYIWQGMKRRCYWKGEANFHLYGGRGITVCDEWVHDFKAFYDWAHANGYKDELTIDRIDNDKGYNPENCRWLTIKEQRYNQTIPVKTFEAFGETKAFSDWLLDERCVVPARTIRDRLQFGINFESAITVRKISRYKNFEA